MIKRFRPKRGAGYYADRGDRIEYRVVDHDGERWTVLRGAFSLYDTDREDYVDDEYLAYVLLEEGVTDLCGLMEERPRDWLDVLTACIAYKHEADRYEVARAVRTYDDVLAAIVELED